MSTITTVFRRSLVLLLLACLSCYPWSNSSRIFAQLPQGPDVNRELARSAAARPHLVHMNVELALVNVTVTDPDNNFVAGLEPDNFRVFEDNVEQEVVNFSTEDNPTSVGVVLDLSGSMAGKLDRAKEAVLEFFKTANPQDEFFLVGFNDQAKLLSPFTDDVEDLQSGMLAITAKGSTALLDAVYLGLIQMKDARCSKRALLIISDGGDNHSRYSERDVKRLVREADTQLYSIGLFDSFEYRARTPEELNGPSLLSEITEHVTLTGGKLRSRCVFQKGFLL